MEQEQVWHDDFQPVEQAEAIWKVPVEWLLSQISLFDRKQDKYIGIAVKDNHLYIEGYNLKRKSELKFSKSWAEEFDPWPDYPVQQ